MQKQLRFTLSRLLLLVALVTGINMWGQTQLVKYQFETNLTADAGSIGSPALTFSITPTYNAGVTGQAVSTNTGGNANGAYVELTISTVGYSDIKVSWAGRTSNNTTPGSWILTGNSGSGYGSTLHSQSLTTTFASTGDINLASAFDNNSVVKLRITASNSQLRNLRIDDFVVKGTSTAGTPLLSTNVSSLTSFGSVNVGANSTSSSFTVSGSSLTADAVVTAPNTNFQVSLNNTDFSSSVNIPFGDGTLTNVPVYVRFTPQSSGAKSGNVTVASTDATSRTVGVSGTGVGPSAALSGTLTESSLNGSSFTITLTNDTFINPLSTAGFTLNSAPSGVTIASVTYATATTATVLLNYNDTDFDVDATSVNVTIAANQLTSNAQLTSGNISISRVLETLTVGSTLAFNNVCVNTTSDSSFPITGTVKAGTISLTAAQGMSFSLTNGSNYTSTLSFPVSAGSLNQTVYVRFSPTLVQSYVVSTTVSGGSASSQNKSLTGNGVNTQGAVNTNTATSITLTGATLRGQLSAVGLCPATIERGFVYSVTSVNGTPEVDGTGVTKIAVGGTINTSQYTQAVTGLSSATNYTVRSYVYDGSIYAYGSAQTFTTLSPPPANDLCSNAIALTVNNPAIAGTLAGAAYTSFSNGGSYKDVWYSFVAGCTGAHTITMTTPSEDNDADIILFANACPTNNNSKIGSSESFFNPEVITADLTAGTTYIIRVLAFNATGESAFTIGVTSVTETPSLTASAATSLTYESASVSATATITGCSGAVTAYGIEYSTVNGFANGAGTQVAGSNLVGTAFSVSITGLLPGTTYYYKSYATNSTGTGYSIQGSFTTTAYLIDAPVATDAENVSFGKFDAIWNAVPDAESYRLDVSTEEDFGTGAPGTLITETFNNIPASNSGYLTRTWTGEGGIEWAAYKARTDQTLTNRAITLKDESAAYLESGTITGGVSNIKFDTQVAFSGSGTLTVKVLSGPTFATETTLGTIEYNASINSFDSGTINITGDYKIRIENNAAGRPSIDNLAFTSTSTLAPSFVAGYENLQVSGTTHTVTGLNPETTYYYRVRSENASPVAVSSNSNTIEVTTLLGNTWNGTAWSEGTAPTAIDLAVIAGDYNTGTDGVFGVNNLIINSGVFTVATGTTFTVQNQITNNAAAANFIVENDATLLQENDAAVNTGDISVYRYTNELFKLDYSIWSSPVTGQDIFDFSVGTLENRFYVYGPNGDNSANVFLTVTAANNNGTENFVPGRGYLIRMPNELTDQMSGYPASEDDYDAGTFSSIFEGRFAGVPNNGDVTVDIVAEAGFNMVGNPYPSAINVQDFFTDNQDNLDPGYGLYFWRKKNNTDATSYAILTTDSYIANDGGVESPDGDYNFGGQQWESYYEDTADASWTIAPGQGFFVRAAAGATGIDFNNDMRETPQQGQPFFRNGNDIPSEKSKLWFNLTAPGVGFSQTSVVYNTSATLGIDAGKDARHFGNSGLTALFTFADDQKLAIQSRPGFEATDVVPLGYRVTTAGTYTIKLHRMEGVFEGGQEVYLRDNVLNVTHNIKGGDYTFTTEPGTFNERFDILYTTEALGINDNIINADAVVVYKQDNVLKVVTGNELMQNITIYDMRGRELYKASAINSGEHTVTGLAIQQQVFLVQVRTPKGTVTKKVIF